MCKRTNASNVPRNCSFTDGFSNHNFLLRSMWRLHKSLYSKCGLFPISYGQLKLRRYFGTLQKLMDCSERFRQHVSVHFVRLLVGVMLVMSLSVAVSKSPSCKFNLLQYFSEIFQIFKDQIVYFIFHPHTYSYCAGALTEENLLFLEAWRTIDRAYIDKTFHGQSWFRYRENALRNEPMNTREQTCMDCIIL